MIAVSACAHDLRSAAPTPAPAPAPNISALTPASAPISASEVTVENLLRWPLEGPTGFDKVEAGLHQVMQMEPLRAQQFTASGPVRLADGNVLLFAWLRRLSGSVSIDVAQEPCISPEQTKALIGAVQGHVIRDMHGGEHGKTCSTTRNGVRVKVTTTPKTYRCVDSIQIHKIRDSNSMTSQEQALRDHPNFRDIPRKIQE
jgi:hypothetical protein